MSAWVHVAIQQLSLWLLSESNTRLGDLYKYKKEVHAILGQIESCHTAIVDVYHLRLQSRPIHWMTPNQIHWLIGGEHLIKPPPTETIANRYDRLIRYGRPTVNTRQLPQQATKVHWNSKSSWCAIGLSWFLERFQKCEICLFLQNPTAQRRPWIVWVWDKLI